MKVVLEQFQFLPSTRRAPGDDDSPEQTEAPPSPERYAPPPRAKPAQGSLV